MLWLICSLSSPFRQKCLFAFKLRLVWLRHSFWPYDRKTRKSFSLQMRRCSTISGTMLTSWLRYVFDICSWFWRKAFQPSLVLASNAVNLLMNWPLSRKITKRFSVCAHVICWWVLLIGLWHGDLCYQSFLMCSRCVPACWTSLVWTNKVFWNRRQCLLTHRVRKDLWMANRPHMCLLVKMNIPVQNTAVSSAYYCM